MSTRRRSQRVLLRMPILVIAIGADKQPISEKTFTAVVNAHGGLIYLAMKVRVGQALILRNPESSEEQSCRVASLSEAHDGKCEVGVEFTTRIPISGMLPSRRPIGLRRIRRLLPIRFEFRLSQKTLVPSIESV